MPGFSPFTALRISSGFLRPKSCTGRPTERQKAAAGIKQEIVEVSGALAEKLLEREINQQDHRALIDSFIEEIGDEND